MHGALLVKCLRWNGSSYSNPSIQKNEGYSFAIRHCRGVLHDSADAVSRRRSTCDHRNAFSAAADTRSGSRSSLPYHHRRRHHLFKTMTPCLGHWPSSTSCHPPCTRIHLPRVLRCTPRIFPIFRPFFYDLHVLTIGSDWWVLRKVRSDVCS